MDNNTVTNLAGILTGKGKNSVSYIRIDNIIVSKWVIDNGGYDEVVSRLQALIKIGKDMHQIRQTFNISPSTIKKFILKNLSKEYRDTEYCNRQLNSFNRRSCALKGKPSKLKGRSYEDIHGHSQPACGFKRGNKNLNFTRDRYIGCTLVNKSGKRFRSSYEVKFSEFLEKNNISYDYEHHFKLLNGKIKIVDFIVNDKLVEVTGYAYPKWQQDFDVKIALLNASYPQKKIIIICDNSKIELLSERHGNYCSIICIDSVKELLKEFSIV